ncbi:MAG: polysaccharide pyruvyl transferase CsaB [Clostridia bacterium]|nr:polysaccharide pyruvyl transferase CsaB [Clostridia bacterium]
MADIVISGYYGLGNTGDEALLRCMIEDLRRISPDITITALSANKLLTKRLYGVNTVNRYNPFAVFKELKKAKVLLSGGGTLIQDATSTRSLLYYLGIIMLAKLAGARVMVYANGMGPIKDKNVKIVNRILNKADIITLRENNSLEEIERCRITSPLVKVTADPAFNLESDDTKIGELFEKFKIPEEKKLMAVSLRSWQEMPKTFASHMAKVLKWTEGSGFYPIFIPMQMQRDLELSKEVASLYGGECSIIDEELPVVQLLALIGKCRIACGMRLHMLIFASVKNVPMAGIAYDPKIKGFMEYMNQKNYIDIKDFNSGAFIKMLENLEENIEEYRGELKKSSAELKKKAEENAVLAVKLAEGTL